MSAALRRARRRAGTYPQVHPAGWYHLLYSDEVGPGQVRAVEALGEDLVVFRTEAGRLHVLHAHCPHLGASLAVGSRVVGDCLECPFHRWRFAGDGHLAEIPDDPHPPRARARAFPTIERYGLVLMWHGPTDAQGQPPYTPDYWPELDTPAFREGGRHAPRDVAMHLLEFAENSVDMQHFGVLHTDMRLPWTQVSIPGMGIHHQAHWEVDPDRPHVAHFYDQAHLQVRAPWLGVRDLPRSGARGHALFVGPASLVVFRISVPDLGDVLIAQTHTPVDAPDQPLGLRVRFTWWRQDSVPWPIAWYVVGNWISQWWADIEIWENKVHLPRPVLSRADGPVHALRRWFRQFYEGVEDDARGGVSSTPAA